MKGKNVIFSSKTIHWETPKEIYDQLNNEFRFNFDPCPFHDENNNAFFNKWTGRVFCNPPYDNKNIRLFLEKGLLELKKGNVELIVYLLPVKTSKKWFHDLVWGKSEIRFFKRRLKFDGANNPAPFDNMLVIFRKIIKKIACPHCGHFIGTVTEKWSARNCPCCGLLVFKE